MIVLVDANILLRIADTTAVQHSSAMAAVSTLCTQGEQLVTCPQALYEFWVVATRPVASNGLGMTPAECDRVMGNLMTAFPLMNDQPTLFDAWRSLVATHACIGKIAHDTRLVAAMNTHGITQILTFNGRDFSRFPAIHVLDPNASLTPSSPSSTTP